MWNRVYTYDTARIAPYPNRFLAEIVQGRNPGRALDVGMGQGSNSLFLARLGWDVTGIDISDKAIDLARKEAARLRLKINYVVADISAFDVGKAKWDLIVGVYMGRLILFQSAALTSGSLPEDCWWWSITAAMSGEFHFRGQLGYPVNALLETFVPRCASSGTKRCSIFPTGATRARARRWCACWHGTGNLMKLDKHLSRRSSVLHQRKSENEADPTQRVRQFAASTSNARPFSITVSGLRKKSSGN